MDGYRAIFFEKENGELPAEAFMKSLDKKMRAKMALAITALQAHGHALREPYSKYLEDGTKNAAARN